MSLAAAASAVELDPAAVAWVTPDQWSIYDTTDSYAVAIRAAVAAGSAPSELPSR